MGLRAEHGKEVGQGGNNSKARWKTDDDGIEEGEGRRWEKKQKKKNGKTRQKTRRDMFGMTLLRIKIKFYHREKMEKKKPESIAKKYNKKTKQN